ncbi:right-handed parallel beta-helix repeat-containing protein [Candidatus Woesearchaeota archaeon]|nr:right-handed parallel beta-helix repeat-containing protein [Candidatus Woesearchaeota archaeon]
MRIDEAMKGRSMDFIVLVVVIAFAMLLASQIDTITGMASSISGTNTSLAISSSADYANISQGEPVTFYANYTNLSGVPINNQSDNGSCVIRFEDTAQSFSMSFNLSGTDVYEYTRTFAAPDTYSWNVTCGSDLYETLVTADSSMVEKTYCGRYVSGSITLTSDLVMSNGSTSCSQHGLLINSSGITIDCAGRTIPGDQNGYGIYSAGFNNLTLINCTLTGFSNGVRFESSTNNRVYYNTFFSNTLHACSDTAGSHFNITVGGKAVGNSWDNACELMIFDSDSDGYGDFGQQYPYNEANGGKVSANVSDWGPVSDNLDSDNDGSPDSEDCNDADSTIFAPRNDILVLQNSTLCPGTYYVDDSVQEGVIRFGGSGLELNCGNAVLVGGGLGSGIYDSYGNNTIKDCTVREYYYGVHAYRANFTSLRNITSEGNDYAGVVFSNSSHGNITDVTAAGNADVGLFITEYSTNNTLSAIVAHDNYLGAYFYYAHNNTLVDSSLYENDWHGLFLDRSECNRIDDSDIYWNQKGVYLAYSHMNNLTGVSVYGNSGSGIVLWFSDGNRIFNTSSYLNSGSGIELLLVRHNLIENTTVLDDDDYCIWLNHSLDTRIYNTTAAGCGQEGLWIYDSRNDTILDNNISSNSFGVRISSSYDTVLGWNDIIDSTFSGLLVEPSAGIVFGNNTVSGGAVGVNISGNSSMTLFNNTVSGSSGDGILLSGSDSVNLTGNTLMSNSGFAIFAVNTTLIPSYPSILSGNTISSDNTAGMLSFNWYIQVHTLNRTGGNASGVDINLTFTGEASPQQGSVTLNTSLTPYITATQYIVNNSGDRIDRTYNISGVKGDFAGENITSITENRIRAENDEIFLTLDIALPPHVTLVSPATNTSTTSHSLNFICNASHEGGLANISLYHNISGNWTLDATNNATGISDETSFALSAPDAHFGWNCEAASDYDSSGFAPQNFTLTVYTLPPAGGGGGGGGGETPPSEAPSEPAPASPPPDTPPAAPSLPPAGPAPSPEGLAPAPAPSGPVLKTVAEAVQTETSISCDEEVNIVEEDVSLEELLKLISVPEGYVVAVRPFKAQCVGGETFTMSIMVPDNLEDVQALRCAGAACSARKTTYTTRICPGQEVEEFREEDVFNISAFAVNITAVSGNLTEGNNSIQSGDYSVDFSGDVEAGLSTVTENQPEPLNKNVRIVGVPVMVNFRQKDASASQVVNLSIPYVLKADDDELSVAVYAKRMEGEEVRWLYVGGSVDTVKKIVTAEVNLSAYAVDGKVTFAPITMLCHECGEAEFANRFTPVPDSRQAIILLHGLWGMGKVWEGLINEFRLTNQPYQLWTFSYLAIKPLNESAMDLANYLEANQHRFDKVYIVGYSLGGLVTQTALRYAYEERMDDPSKYSFIGKVGKVILVGTPNEGTPVVKYLDTFLSEYINSEATDVVPMNSMIKEILGRGLNLEPVPNVSYYVIAGTKPYPFLERLGLTRLLFGTQPNDGLVSVASAQNVGGEYLDEECVNFWSQPVIHTLLIDDRLVQKIMGQIIASDIFKELAEEQVHTNLFGYSNYFELEIDDCDPDDLYVVIGKEKESSEVERAAYCACGNGVCDGLEDISACPADCLIVEKPLVQRIIERSLSILALLLVIFIMGGFVFVLYEHRKKKRQPPELPPGFNMAESEGIPHDMISYMRVEIEGLKKSLNDVRKKRKLMLKEHPEKDLLESEEEALKKAEEIIKTRLQNIKAQMKHEEAAGGKRRKENNGARKTVRKRLGSRRKKK